MLTAAAFAGFYFTSRQIAKGSQLRLVVNGPNSLYSQNNYKSASVVVEEPVADARVATKA